MKKFICFALVLILLISSLCACAPVVIDEGTEREIYDETFVEIESRNMKNNHIVYDKDTKIVYYLETAGGTDGGHLSPYLIYQDGYIYGAIFQDGEIKPMPYASAPLK